MFYDNLEYRIRLTINQFFTRFFIWCYLFTCYTEMQTGGGSDHNRPRTHLWSKFLVVLKRGIQISFFTIRRGRKYAISWELWTRWLSIPSSCSRGMERWSKWHWNWARLGNGFKTQGKNIHRLTEIFVIHILEINIIFINTHNTDSIANQASCSSQERETQFQR